MQIGSRSFAVPEWTSNIFPIMIMTASATILGGGMLDSFHITVTMLGWGLFIPAAWLATAAMLAVCLGLLAGLAGFVWCLLWVSRQIWPAHEWKSVFLIWPRTVRNELRLFIKVEKLRYAWGDGSLHNRYRLVGETWDPRTPPPERNEPIPTRHSMPRSHRAEGKNFID